MIKTLTDLFKLVVTESYYQRNTADKVIYPYLVYTVRGEPLRTNANGFYVDVDLFDNQGHDDERIEACLFALMRSFESYDQLTDDFLLQLQFLNSNPIPTGSDTLQRRNMQFYCKVDWRK